MSKKTYTIKDMIIELNIASKEVPPEIQKEAESILAKARFRLLKHRFFGSMLLTMKMSSVPGLKTYATDGISIFYDPFVVVNEKTVRMAVASLLHEVLHKILMHFLRVGKYEKRKWNLACDYAINPIVKDEGFDEIETEKEFVYQPAFAKMSAEQIYQLLTDEQAQSPVANHLLTPLSKKGEPLTESEIKDLQLNIESQIINANEAHKEYGLKSSTLKELVASLKKNKIQWENKLFRLIKGNHPEDYTWSRPNRRYLHAGLYLPSVEKRSVGNIYIWPDSSGSMGKKELVAIATELTYILKIVKPLKTVVVHCDAKIHKVVEYDPSDSPEGFEFVGRGGTDPKPFFEFVNQQSEVHCAICMTDMGFDHNIPQPRYPVLWLSTVAKQQPPFGELIEIQVD
jgi:predicted metal-dependent peptidase